MSQFEYLAAAVSVVLSLGAIRLIDGIPHAFARDRRYWPHAVWLLNVLALHIQTWWIFWDFHQNEEWTYPEFLLALAVPGLLYALARAVTTATPEQVDSWRAHFWQIRVRMFVLAICAVASVALLGWASLDIPLVHPLRIVQGTITACLIAGALWANPTFQAVLAYFILAALVGRSLWTGFSAAIFGEP